MNLSLLFTVLYVKRESILAIVGRVIHKAEVVSEQEINRMNLEPYFSEARTEGGQLQGKKRILFLGNSISLHGLSKEVNWTHVSGMAASSEEKDYIHRLVRQLSEEWRASIEYKIVNIADFERGYPTFNYDRLSDIKTFNPDLTVFQIGENVSSSELNRDEKPFHISYVKLVKSIDSKNRIVCLPFWPDKQKNKVITEVALETNSFLVDLSHLGSGIEPLNFASSERNYSHPGVAIHPGDYGMENIAKTIFSVARYVVK
jgi:hypothetical protein